MKLYSTQQAAQYLGLSLSALKYHIYEKHVEPQMIGNSLVFTQAQLDDFQKTRGSPGRPKKETK